MCISIVHGSIIAATFAAIPLVNFGHLSFGTKGVPVRTPVNLFCFLRATSLARSLFGFYILCARGRKTVNTIPGSDPLGHGGWYKLWVCMCMCVPIYVFIMLTSSKEHFLSLSRWVKLDQWTGQGMEKNGQRNSSPASPQQRHKRKSSIGEQKSL